MSAADKPPVDMGVTPLGTKRPPPSPSAIKTKSSCGVQLDEDAHLEFHKPHRTGYACESARRKFAPDYHRTTTRGATEAPESNAAHGSALPEAVSICRSKEQYTGGEGREKNRKSKFGYGQQGCRRGRNTVCVISRVLGSQKERRAPANISVSKRVC